MSEYDRHLYAILYPNDSLVASQVGPIEFGRHYTFGSAKHFNGKVIFIEIDPELKSEFFQLKKAWECMIPHEDGTPKRTKVVANYRVMENIPMEAYGDMYLTTVDGKTLKLPKSEYSAMNEPGLIRIYQQIAPMQMVIASRQDQRDFGQYYTHPGYMKGCPQLCYTQIDLNIEEFVRMQKDFQLAYQSLPNIPNYRIMDCIDRLNKNKEEMNKTVSLASIFDDLSFKRLRHGFWLACLGKQIFYPFPSIQELESTHYSWWRSAELT